MHLHTFRLKMLSTVRRSLASRETKSVMRPAIRLCTRTFALSNSEKAKKRAAAPSQLLDEFVMEHLVCPISKLPLRYDATRGLLICPEIRVAYPIVHGVPMLVPTEGRVLRDDEEA